MLRGLNIRDMVIIDRLDIDFQAGLNVLTGETGAGKSILLDCLGFVLGWRGSSKLVRSGAKQGEVTAWFEVDVDHPSVAILEEAGFDYEGDLILRRVNTADGRKTAYINDRRCSGEVLRRVGDTLIELHGQHDDRGLLNVKGHRDLLDDFAKADAAKKKCRSAWRDMADARKALEARAAELAELKSEEDFLRHAVEELDKLDPQTGEEAALDVARRTMQASEKIREDIAQAIGEMGSDGAEPKLMNATRWLETAAGKLDNPVLDDAISALSRAISEMGEAQSILENFAQDMDFDPHALEQTEERLFAIRALARKHNITAEALPEFAKTLRGRLHALDQSEGDMTALQEAVEAAQAAYDQAAASLTQYRQKAAKRLDTAMAEELAPLKMERAVFTTMVEATTAGPEGVDQVSFQVATNPGSPAGQLNKIASGGELSRFLLALKVCLTEGAAGLTLIFDEIDRGVGGATANAVGRRLSDLGRDGQVLVVTHSPQVAALGNAHLRVEKSVVKDVTRSNIVVLDELARADEIARMLSGDSVTPEALAAAKSLLEKRA